MILKVGVSGSNYKTLKSGQYNGKCIDVIYPIIKQYKDDKPKQTVMFVFDTDHQRELADGTKGEGNDRLWSKNLSLTMAPKGHLKPFLEDWLDKKLGNGDEVTLESFVGMKAELLVKEVAKRNGDGTYAQIVGISPSDTDVETDPDYERQDPAKYSDVVVREYKEDAPPF